MALRKCGKTDGAHLHRAVRKLLGRHNPASNRAFKAARDTAPASNQAVQHPCGSKKHYEEKEIPLQFKVLFHLAVFGRFRRGKLIALTWDDIDFQNHAVTVSKASAKTKGGIITKVPKTFSSNRTVTLPASTMGLIRRHKEEQQRYRLSLGTYWKGGNYLFTQDDGRQMDISTPNKVFKKVIRIYNGTHADKLPEITLHGLRHTSATLLIAQNVDIKTVSSRLGHSETSTTLDIYAHALKKQDGLAAESLGELFARSPQKQCWPNVSQMQEKHPLTEYLSFATSLGFTGFSSLDATGFEPAASASRTRSSTLFPMHTSLFPIIYVGMPFYTSVFPPYIHSPALFRIFVGTLLTLPKNH